MVSRSSGSGRHLQPLIARPRDQSLFYVDDSSSGGKTVWTPRAGLSFEAGRVGDRHGDGTGVEEPVGLADKAAGDRVPLRISAIGAGPGRDPRQDDVKAVLRQVHNGFHYTLGFGGSVHAQEYHILAIWR